MKNESSFVACMEVKFSMKCSDSVRNSALQKYDCFNTVTDTLET